MRFVWRGTPVALLIVIFRKVLGVDLIFCFLSLAVKQATKKSRINTEDLSYWFMMLGLRQD